MEDCALVISDRVYDIYTRAVCSFIGSGKERSYKRSRSRNVHVPRAARLGADEYADGPFFLLRSFSRQSLFRSSPPALSSMSTVRLNKYTRDERRKKRGRERAKELGEKFFAFLTRFIAECTRVHVEQILSIGKKCRSSVLRFLSVTS